MFNITIGAPFVSVMYGGKGVRFTADAGRPIKAAPTSSRAFAAADLNVESKFAATAGPGLILFIR